MISCTTDDATLFTHTLDSMHAQQGAQRGKRLARKRELRCSVDAHLPKQRVIGMKCSKAVFAIDPHFRRDCTYD